MMFRRLLEVLVIVLQDYLGLQLADFSAYLIDFVSNEHPPDSEDSELRKAYARFAHKVVLVHVP